MPSSASWSPNPSPFAPMAADSAVGTMGGTIRSEAGAFPLPAMGPAGWAGFHPAQNEWVAPVASALLPGAGQAILHRSRALPYLAVEVFGWVQYLRETQQGRRRREDYRTLARDVARARFSDSLPVGNWEYYESMEKFVESGVYDLRAGGAFTPDTDPTTFNGSVWLLARRTFWENDAVPPPVSSPEFQRAEDFYLHRAVRPEYRWSWRSAMLEQDVYRSAIHESNAAFRVASQFLGVVLANHALSAVDAFVTLRLQGTADGHQYRVSGSIPWAPFGRTHEGARHP